MAKEPLKDEAEVEVICPRCGYHLRDACVVLHPSSAPTAANSSTHPARSKRVGPQSGAKGP
jgi:hypothetical protein